MMTKNELNKLKESLPSGYRKLLASSCKCAISMVDKALSGRNSETIKTIEIITAAALMATNHKNKMSELSQLIEQL